MKQVSMIDKAVTLVTVPSLLSFLSRPQHGDYDNPYILRTRPCAKKDGKFYDLRTGEQVIKTDEMLEWNNLTGSLFRYPDGYELLLSRQYTKEKAILVLEPENDYNPNSVIIRPVIHKVEKKKSH